MNLIFAAIIGPSSDMARTVHRQRIKRASPFQEFSDHRWSWSNEYCAEYLQWIDETVMESGLSSAGLQGLLHDAEILLVDCSSVWWGTRLRNSQPVPDQPCRYLLKSGASYYIVLVDLLDPGLHMYPETFTIRRIDELRTFESIVAHLDWDKNCQFLQLTTVLELSGRTWADLIEKGLQSEI